MIAAVCPTRASRPDSTLRPTRELVSALGGCSPEAPHSEAIAPSCSSFSNTGYKVPDSREQIAADLFDAPRDAVAVQRTLHVERSSEEVRAVAHCQQLRYE